MPEIPATLVQLIGVLLAALATVAAPSIAAIVVANRNARLAREAAQEVARKLDTTTSQTSRKLDAIHSLVNGRLSAAIEKIDRLEQRLFETDGTPPTGEDPPPAPYPHDSA